MRLTRTSLSGLSWISAWIQTTQPEVSNTPESFLYYGFPEEWIKWVMAFRAVENLIRLKDSADKTRMFWTLLKVQALCYFEHHLRRRVEAEYSEPPENDLIELSKI
jgi:hypothetical protein